MWDNEQTATLTECKEEPEDEYIPQPVKNDGQQIVIADDDEIAPNYVQPKFHQQQFNQQQQFPQMFYHMQNNQTVYQDQQHHSGQWQQQQAWQQQTGHQYQQYSPFVKMGLQNSNEQLFQQYHQGQATTTYSTASFNAQHGLNMHQQGCVPVTSLPSSNFMMNSQTQGHNSSGVPIKQVFTNYQGQQLFGQQFNQGTQPSIVIQSHPNHEMFSEGTGEEMFTLQPAMPNLNASYGNFVEDPSNLSNEETTTIKQEDCDDEENNDEPALELSTTFENTKAMKDHVYYLKDLINDLVLQTKIHAKNSGRYRKACQDHDDMLPDVAYAECKSLCYKTLPEMARDPPKLNATQMRKLNKAFNSLKIKDKPELPEMKTALKVMCEIGKIDDGVEQLIEELYTHPEGFDAYWNMLNSGQKKWFNKNRSLEENKVVPRPSRKMGRPRTTPTVRRSPRGKNKNNNAKNKKGEKAQEDAKAGSKKK
ncbi:Oidioi.mRNA.OKI2018_I69.XSR.g14066.t1.cds [Oikopleura dioica]|uniref:Oidioi.mRNA.OKI2018_I69.XSR.g14066.t1.cds n=1 Tax=Oikopleura dioica TaxID=34765 RepID=A0ABN7S8P9_OIKDI|nr:Oidioi.mRNA.OKI2018_I69.XSR.g14066.t1.cds [Oikopleura dioica]